MTDRILNPLGHFSNEEKAAFQEKLVKKNFSRNELLLAEGGISAEAFFIVEGAAYEYDCRDIDENVTGLFTTGDCCVNYKSFVQQSPARSSIRAYSDVETWSLSASAAHSLIAVSPRFYQLGAILEKAIERLRHFDAGNTAKEMYAHLLRERPDYFQQFPLKMIASYLKISPETLSRLRSQR